MEILKPTIKTKDYILIEQDIWIPIKGGLVITAKSGDKLYADINEFQHEYDLPPDFSKDDIESVDFSESAYNAKFG